MTSFRDLVEKWSRGELQPAPVAELVGFQLVSLEGGVATVEMQAGVRHHNPMGRVHGGILCDLADAAMGIAFACTLAEGEGFTTLELQIRYLRPVHDGLLRGIGRVVHRGRRTGHAECEIVDDTGKTIALASSVCLLLAAGD